MIESSVDISSLPSTAGSFNFLSHSPVYDKEKPYIILGPLAEEKEKQRSNLHFEKHPEVPVRDLRPVQDALDIERHGFKVLQSPPRTHPGLFGESMLQDYILEMIEIMKGELNSDFVLCYDYRFRKNVLPKQQVTSEFQGTWANPAQPNNTPHIDITTGYINSRLHKQLTEEEADKYLDGTWRIRLVNMWRPMFQTVVDAPLAFCDGTSVDWTDLVPVDRIAHRFLGEVYYVRHNANQRWYWFSNLTPEEVVLFVNYDSDPSDWSSPFTPHSAFFHKGIPSDVPPRQSLEIRTIVITKKDKEVC